MDGTMQRGRVRCFRPGLGAFITKAWRSSPILPAIGRAILGAPTLVLVRCRLQMLTTSDRAYKMEYVQTHHYPLRQSTLANVEL